MGDLTTETKQYTNTCPQLQPSVIFVSKPHFTEPPILIQNLYKFCWAILFIGEQSESLRKKITGKRLRCESQNFFASAFFFFFWFVFVFVLSFGWPTMTMPDMGLLPIKFLKPLVLPPA